MAVYAIAHQLATRSRTNSVRDRVRDRVPTWNAVMWFKVDDRLHGHPKVRAAGNSAMGLWTRLGSWASDHLTDGFVPRSVVREYGSRRDLQRLLLVRMVETGTHPEFGDGYYVHDYLDCNPSRIEVLAERAKAAARKAKWKERHGNANQDELWTDDDAGNAVPNAAPTRPDPTRPARITSVERLTTTDTPAESSSSVDELLRVAAAGIALNTGHVARGPYAKGVERNLRAERLAEFEELAATGSDALTVVAEIVGSKVHARQAYRELRLEIPSTNGAHP